MNFVPKESFNSAMQSPQIAAELVRLLTEDMGICIAIMGGPDATEDIHKELCRALNMNLLQAAQVAQKRINNHLTGKTIIIPSHRLN